MSTPTHLILFFLLCVFFNLFQQLFYKCNVKKRYFLKANWTAFMSHFYCKMCLVCLLQNFFGWKICLSCVLTYSLIALF